MLIDFKNNSFYQYASNLDKFYHAYLFEVDDIEASFSLILSFAKMIICKNHYIDNTKCNDCNICHLIDKNTFSDLKIIDAEGSIIKKEQILSLQKDLSLKSVNNNNQVYIIKEADKMNQSASNSLLKFIEEPEPGIYGIFITTNRKALLPTIISRCVLITLKSVEKKEYNESDISNLSYFLKQIFKNKKGEIPYLKKEFFSFYEKREDIIYAFNIMEEIIDFLINLKYEINIDKNICCDIIKTNLSDISLENLINCLDKIVIYKNKLINVININLNLFMDRFIIDVSEVLK